MNEKIEIYESLLIQKSKLEKEAEMCFEEYVREFGEEVQTVFEAKLNSITLKKKIAFCVKKEYLDEPIYLDELEAYVDTEILEYQSQLDDLKETRKYVSSIEYYGNVKFDDRQRIRKLYYAIVHMIHPDLHPELQKDEQIKEAWQKAVDAYKRNDLKTVQEVFDLVSILIKEDDAYFEIDDIDNKMDKAKQEIEEIKNTNPYQYKFILDTEESINDQHKIFKDQIDSYNDYIKSLEKELSRFKIISRGGA